MDLLCYLYFVFVMLSHLFIAALWSPAGKGLTSWLLFMMFNCIFVTIPCGFRFVFFYFPHATYSYKSYWLCDRCDRGFMLKSLAAVNDVKMQSPFD